MSGNGNDGLQDPFPVDDSQEAQQSELEMRMGGKIVSPEDLPDCGIELDMSGFEEDTKPVAAVKRAPAVRSMYELRLRPFARDGHIKGGYSDTMAIVNVDLAKARKIEAAFANYAGEGMAPSLQTAFYDTFHTAIARTLDLPEHLLSGLALPLVGQNGDDNFTFIFPLKEMDEETVHEFLSRVMRIPSVVAGPVTEKYRDLLPGANGREVRKALGLPRGLDQHLSALVSWTLGESMLVSRFAGLRAAGINMPFLDQVSCVGYGAARAKQLKTELVVRRMATQGERVYTDRDSLERLVQVTAGRTAVSDHLKHDADHGLDASADGWQSRLNEIVGGELYLEQVALTSRLEDRNMDVVVMQPAEAARSSPITIHNTPSRRVLTRSDLEEAEALSAPGYGKVKRLAPLVRKSGMPEKITTRFHGQRLTMRGMTLNNVFEGYTSVSNQVWGVLKQMAEKKIDEGESSVAFSIPRANYERINELVERLGSSQREYAERQMENAYRDTPEKTWYSMPVRRFLAGDMHSDSAQFLQFAINDQLDDLLLVSDDSVADQPTLRQVLEREFSCTNMSRMARSYLLATSIDGKPAWEHLHPQQQQDLRAFNDGSAYETPHEVYPVDIKEALWSLTTAAVIKHRFMTGELEREDPEIYASLAHDSLMMDRYFYSACEDYPLENALILKVLPAVASVVPFAKEMQEILQYRPAA